MTDAPGQETTSGPPRTPGRTGQAPGAPPAGFRRHFRRLEGLLRYLPLAATPLLLWLLSRDQVKVKPTVWVSLGYVVAFALLTAWGSRRPRWIDYVLAALAGVAATHVLFYPGFPQGHDITTHLWGTYGFFETIHAGVPLPLWVHHLGLGMPFPMFYPPLAFYLMLPFEAFRLPVYDSFKYGFVLFNVLSGLSMYFVVHRWTSSRSGALVAAAAYCFAPYHLLESQYRVAVAEAAGMAILPLFFYTMHRAVASPGRTTWRGAATWTALLAVTHPLSLSMAGVAMGLWTLATCRFRPSKLLFKRLGMLFLVALLGLVAAGYYTIPVAAESRYASITHTLGGRKPLYGRYGLKPSELVVRRAWSKWQRAEPRGSKSEHNEMPFYFGISLLAMLPLAWPRRSSRTGAPESDYPRPDLESPGAPRGAPEDPKAGRAESGKQEATDPGSDVVPGLMVVTLGALALTLYPMDVLFARFPPMTILQFPWRFLAIATFGASALAGFATRTTVAGAGKYRWGRLLPAGFVALMVFDFFPYQGAASWRAPFDGVYRMAERRKGIDKLPFRVDHLSFPPSHTDIDLSLLRRVYPEYFTPTTRRAFKNTKKDSVLERAAVGVTFKKRKRTLHPRPYAEFFPKDGGKPVGLAFERAGERIRVSLPGRAGRLEIKEQWFPGWMVTLGDRHFEVASTSDGLMVIPLAATDGGTVTLHFSRTRWDRLLGAVVTPLTLALLWWPAPWPFRRKPRHDDRTDT